MSSSYVCIPLAVSKIWVRDHPSWSPQDLITKSGNLPVGNSRGRQESGLVGILMKIIYYHVDNYFPLLIFQLFT